MTQTFKVPKRKKLEGEIVSADWNVTRRRLLLELTDVDLKQDMAEHMDEDASFTLTTSTQSKQRFLEMHRLHL